MKICPKCKQQYADNVAVCRADGTFLDLDTPVSEAETQPNVLNKDTAAADAPHVAESVDRVGTAAAETFDRAPGDFGVGGGAAAASSGSVVDATRTDFSRIDDSASAGDDYAENPMSGWLVPLIIVAVLIILGFMFCSKRAAASAAVETNEIQMNGATNKLI
ncbi:MAG TPA: hypothetical protein VK400_12890 [Pyrinomonadaceae bacterium]|nr:hypothetical protein [Pyrinomonadaceae bacterium]